jgi:hypothetical protein
MYMDRLNPLNDFAFQKSLGESGGVKDGRSDTQDAGEDGPDSPRSGDDPDGKRIWAAGCCCGKEAAGLFFTLDKGFGVCYTLTMMEMRRGTRCVCRLGIFSQAINEGKGKMKLNYSIFRVMLLFLVLLCTAGRRGIMGQPKHDQDSAPATAAASIIPNIELKKKMLDAVNGDGESHYWSTIGAENDNMNAQYLLVIYIMNRQNLNLETRGIFWLKKAAEQSYQPIGWKGITTVREAKSLNNLHDYLKEAATYKTQILTRGNKCKELYYL